ncbi:hypothetical protein [Eubacterium aggregans]|nr:hypothetical protein [Eubacterium aggregans]MDD4692064.1 hypothetical protein [Eubacterium aggregans]
MIPLTFKFGPTLCRSIAGQGQPGEIEFVKIAAREILFLMDTIDYIEAELAKLKDNLKKCINHKDDHVCAVFDLDWVNEDYRLYDLAWMGYPITASWNVHTWGFIPMNQTQRFLNIYDARMRKNL